MPLIKPDVMCANCRRKQEDQGKRVTCEYCGCFPLPSYSYDKNSSFHPVNCNCTTDRAPPVKVNYKPRVTPTPTLKL